MSHDTKQRNIFKKSTTFLMGRTDVRTDCPSKLGLDALKLLYHTLLGVQWLSGRVLDSRPKGHGFQPQWRHYLVVLEQDTFILA